MYEWETYTGQLALFYYKPHKKDQTYKAWGTFWWEYITWKERPKSIENPPPKDVYDWLCMLKGPKKRR